MSIVTNLPAPPARMRHEFVVVRHETINKRMFTVIRLYEAQALYRVQSVDFLRVTCDWPDRALFLEALENLHALGKIR